MTIILKKKGCGDFLLGLSRISRVEHNTDEVSVLVLSDFTPNTLRQFVDIAEPAAVDRIDYESRGELLLTAETQRTQRRKRIFLSTDYADGTDFS